MKLYLVAHMLLLVLSRHRRLWRSRRCCWSHRNRSGLDPGFSISVAASVSRFGTPPVFLARTTCTIPACPVCGFVPTASATRVSFFPPGVGISNFPVTVDSIRFFIGRLLMVLLTTSARLVRICGRRNLSVGPLGTEEIANRRTKSLGVIDRSTCNSGGRRVCKDRFSNAKVFDTVPIRIGVSQWIVPNVGVLIERLRIADVRIWQWAWLEGCLSGEGIEEAALKFI